MATTGVLGTGFWIGQHSTSAAKTPGPNEKLNLAFIGVGGRGADNVKGLKDQNMVAFCDVDGERARKSYEAFPKVKRFVDFRKMLDDVGSKLDGVVISTPDHMHFHPALAAIQMGKHVYLEKPMAHNIWETRTLCDMARKQKVATQLGVQRHTLENMHRVVELIQAGTIGRVKEVHCWIGGNRGMPKIPSEKPSVPSHLNWKLWLGPARSSDYHPSVAPYGWRFWWDYGTGEMGNWGCHILDIPFWALGLKHPHKVSASGPKVDSLRTPKQMNSTLHFEESFLGEGKKNGPVVLHWDHAQSGPEILKKTGISAKGNNTLFIGEDGMLVCGFGQRKLLPESKFGNHQSPEKSIKKSPGFYKEWVEACRGGEPATCNFEYSGPLAETVMLANMAYRSGVNFNWDAKLLKADNDDAQRWVKETYAKGWEVQV